MKTTMFKSAILLATVFFMSSCDKESLVPISEVSQVTNQEEERANQGDVDFTHFNNETDGRTFNEGLNEAQNNGNAVGSDATQDDYNNETDGRTHADEQMSQSSTSGGQQSDATQNDYSNETDGRTFNGDSFNQSTNSSDRESDATQDDYNNETPGQTHADSNLNKATSDKNALQGEQTHQTSKDGAQFAGPPIIRDK